MSTNTSKTKLILIFPPGWNMNVGSPHLGIPLLQAVLKNAKAEVFIRDLNWEISECLNVKPSLSQIYSAIEYKNLDSLNEPYFRAEDKLMEIAKEYRATWNVQLGFQYTNYTPDSSIEIMEAATVSSPFQEYYKENVLPYIKETEPHIIGFSIASPGQLIPAFQLCRLLKQSGFPGIIIMGGNIISRLRDSIDIPNLYNFVDVFVFYQGEYSIIGIINKLNENKADFSDIPNLAFFDGKKVIITPILEKLNLQNLPAPDFDGFPLGKYWGENYVPLVATRGCYHGKCHFCAIPLGWNEKGYAGTRTPELVFNDMVHQYRKYGITRFKFVDEALIPNLMVAIAKKIKESKLPFEWEGYARLEKIWLNEEFVETVAKGGFRKGYFGLEVYPIGNRGVLNKQDYLAPEKLLKTSNEYGIKAHFFCLFGFPGTGRREAEATIDFILNHANFIDTIDIYKFGYMRHTQVPGAKPLIDPKKDWAMEYDWVSIDKGILSKDEVEVMKVELEEIMWNEHPQMLHPTYRLVSPWSRGWQIEKSIDLKPQDKTLINYAITN